MIRKAIIVGLAVLALGAVTVSYSKFGCMRRLVLWALFGALGMDVSVLTERWIRRNWCPRWMRLAVSTIAFFPLLYLAGRLIESSLDWWAGGRVLGFNVLADWLGSEPVALAVVIVLAGFLAYAAARTLFTLLTFRLVTYDDRYCAHCSYDLTGNVSGVCPECGTAI